TEKAGGGREQMTATGERVAQVRAASGGRLREQHVEGVAVQSLREIDVHVLGLGVLVERVRAELAAEAALLVAAERQGRIDRVPAVDPDRACSQLVGDLDRVLVVGAPDPA